MNIVVDQKSKRRETFYQFLESSSIYPIFYSRSPAMEQEKSLSIGVIEIKDDALFCLFQPVRGSVFCMYFMFIYNKVCLFRNWDIC